MHWCVLRLLTPQMTVQKVYDASLLRDATPDGAPLLAANGAAEPAATSESRLHAGTSTSATSPAATAGPTGASLPLRMRNGLPRCGTLQAWVQILPSSGNVRQYTPSNHREKTLLENRLQ